MRKFPWGARFVLGLTSVAAMGSGGCTDVFFRDQILDFVGPTVAVASPGSDQIANPGQAVLLDGSGSFLGFGSGNTTPAVDAGFVFLWELTGAPAGAVAPTLKNANSSQLTFTATTPGRYIVSLTVSDGVHTGVSDVVVDIL